MRGPYPLARLTPDVAGKLLHDHQRTLKQLEAERRYIAELHKQLRNTLGTEHLWTLQRQARTAIAVQALEKELLA